MDYEKAYKEALEKARQFSEYPLQEDSANIVEYIFPELAESDGERIRKRIYNYINVTLDDNESEEKEKWLTWLEKQGEKLPVGFYYVNSEGKKFYSDTFKYGNVTLHVERQGEQPRYNIGDVLCDKLCTTLDKNTQPNFEIVDIRNGMYICDKGSFPISQQDEYELVAKRIEQNPADKVEPKFKMEKGKWYVCDTSRYTDFIVGKAYYCPQNGMLKPNENAIARYVARDCFHLWTIEDAKDGDVLIHNGYVFVFMGIKDGIVQAVEENTLEPVPFGEPNKKNDYYPATKEQRDLLFTKMKEAGYEWDAEKKELKKIEQKPAWSEEDEERLQSCLNILQAKGIMGVTETINTKWLKSLKEKIGG